MYTPDHFRITDPELIRTLVHDNPFATLVSVGGAGLEATHLPMRMDPNDPNRLFGHVAAGNPVHKSFENPVLVIFHGPHAYVSAEWYEGGPHVPTWNYLAVHAAGNARIFESEEEVISQLQALTRTFEEDPSPENVDDDFLRKKLPGLVCFQIEVATWTAKAKLSQNQSEANRQRVRARLEASSDPMDRLVASHMPERL